MGKAETKTYRTLEAHKLPFGWRLFRHLNGTWYQGEVVTAMMKGSTRPTTMLKITGTAKIGEEHESDIFALIPRKITTEDIGKTFAQFGAIEVKTKSYKTVTKGQMRFLRAVVRCGGMSLICSEWDNEEGYLLETIDEYERRMEL